VELRKLRPGDAVEPGYTDVGSCRFSLSEKDAWICAVAPDGKERRHITADPFSRQWIYVLTQGSYGILRSPQGWIRDRIVLLKPGPQSWLFGVVR
jgi:hypothetical protein